MQSDLVWEGSIGSIPLRVEVPHAGKILAQWDSPNGPRQKTCASIEEFERSVLFQIIMSSGESGTGGVEEILHAVTVAEAERPAPRARQEVKPRRKKPKRVHHRRSRRPPRRR